MNKKIRLLVMNGQKLLESQQNESWTVEGVERSTPLKAGVYNLFNCVDAEPLKVYEGRVVHVDNEHIYQQVGSVFVKHLKANIGFSVTTGDTVTISHSIFKQSDISEPLRN